MGVFVVAAMVACDGDSTGPESPETGYIYASGYMEAIPGIQNYLAKTGEVKTKHEWVEPCISADVDPDTGDVFLYTWNYLKRYTPEGELKFNVRAMTERYAGREYIGLNSETGIVYFLNGEGRVYRFRADNGEEVGILRATGMEDAEQFLVDDDENRLWIVGRFGGEVGKYNREGDEIFKMKSGPYTRICVEPGSDVVILGAIKSRGNYLYRYTKTGARVKEIATGIEPKCLGVEPGTGIIWISDGTAIARYTADGAKLPGISGVGFDFIDFGPDGDAAFIVSPDGYFSAYSTRDLKEVWRVKLFPTMDDVHLFKYNEN